MGMDVYGLNPVLKGARPEIDWSSNPSEEEKQAYFKASLPHSQTISLINPLASKTVLAPSARMDLIP